MDFCKLGGIPHQAISEFLLLISKKVYELIRTLLLAGHNQIFKILNFQIHYTIFHLLNSV